MKYLFILSILLLSGCAGSMSLVSDSTTTKMGRLNENLKNVKVLIPSEDKKTWIETTMDLEKIKTFFYTGDITK